MSGSTEKQSAEARAAEQELNSIYYVLTDRELQAPPAWASPGVNWMLSLYHRRYVATYERWRWLTRTAPAIPAPASRPAPAATPVPAATPMHPAAMPASAAAASAVAPQPVRPRPVMRPQPSPPPAPPRPPLRERLFQVRDFFSDHAILILSYLGAFLLLVATLLFELYGARDFNGPVRFAAVLGTNIVFAIAARVCMERDALRVVGRTYTAIFALLTPLTFAAATEFLNLADYGVTAPITIAAAGGWCAFLYAQLAVRLRSFAYATLSMLALLAGWLGAATAAGTSRWTAVTVVPLAAVYAVIAQRDGEPWRRPARFGRVADILSYAVTAGTLCTATATVAATNDGVGAELPLTLLAIGLVHGLGHVVGRRSIDLGLSLTTLGTAAMAGSQSLGTGYDGAALTLAALALALITGAPSLGWYRLPEKLAGAAAFITTRRVFGAAMLVTACALQVPDTWVQVSVLAAAIVGAAALVVESNENWYFIAGLAAIAVQCAAVASTPGGFQLVTDVPRYPFVPTSLGELTLAVGVLAMTRHTTRTLVAIVAGFGVTTLTAEFSFAADPVVVGWSLLGIAMVYFGAAAFVQLRQTSSTTQAIDPHALLLGCLGAAHVLAAAGVVAAPPPQASLMVIAVVAMGCATALALRRAWVLLLLGIDATAMQFLVGLPVNVSSRRQVTIDVTASVPGLPQVAVGVTATLVATALVAWVLRRRDLIVVVALLATASALCIDYAAGFGLTVAAVELTLLAAGAAAVARWTGEPNSLLVRTVAAAQLVAAAGLLDQPQGAAVALLLSVVALAAYISVDAADARWLLLGLAALGSQTVALAADGTIIAVGSVPYLLVLPCTLAGLTAALVVTGGRLSPQRTEWLVPIAVLATALTATLSALGDANVYAAVLCALAVAGCALPLGRIDDIRRHVGDVTITAEILAAASLPVFPEVTRVAVLLTAVAVSTRLAWRDNEPLWTGLGVVALVTQSLVVTGGGASVIGAPFVPVTLGAITAACVVFAVAHRRTDMVMAIKVGTTLTVLSGERTVGVGANGYAVALLVLGSAYILTTLLPLREHQRLAGRLGGIAHLAVAAVVPTTPPELQGGLVLAGAATIVCLAVIERQANWTYLAAAALAWAWHSLVVVPAQTDTSATLSARTYIALPTVFLGIGLAVQRALGGPGHGRSWARPWLVASVVAAAGVTFAEIVLVDGTGTGAVLILGGVAAYRAALAAGARVYGGALVACIAIPLGVVLMTWSLGAPAETTCVILLVAGAVDAGLRVVIRRAGGDAWRGWQEVHSAAAIVTVLGATAVALALPGAADPNGVASPLGFTATITLAALVALEQRLRHLPVLDYVAIVLGGLAPIWLAVDAGARNPQWFIVSPGLAAIFAGLFMVHDRRISLDIRLARGVVASGSGLLLATTGLQALEVLPGGAPGYVVVLLLESVISVLAGIGLGNRTLVVAGAAGALAAGVRALQKIVFVVPLYSVFGGAALVLLTVAWALALTRERWTRLRAEFGESWQHWA